MSTFDDMRELRDDLEMAEAGGLPAWLTTRTKLGRELQALARKHYARWVQAELQLVTLRADAEKAREATDAERATNERLTADVERLQTLLREAAEEIEHYSRERAALVAAAEAWDKAASAYYASEGTPSEWDAMQAAKRTFHAALRGAR